MNLADQDFFVTQSSDGRAAYLTGSPGLIWEVAGGNAISFGTEQSDNVTSFWGTNFVGAVSLKTNANTENGGVNSADNSGTPWSSASIETTGAFGGNFFGASSISSTNFALANSAGNMGDTFGTISGPFARNAVRPQTENVSMMGPEFSANIVSISNQSLENMCAALGLMKERAAGGWKIDDSVFAVSTQVCYALSRKGIEQPQLFSHGPKSVVFFWTNQRAENLYLTVSDKTLAVLISDESGIRKRGKLPSPNLVESEKFLGALKHW